MTTDLRPTRPARPVLALLALVTGLLLLGAAPAAADTPVEGSPQPDAAPILAPGTYTDTIRSGETLYYGVQLQVGQRAKGRFIIDGTKNPDQNRYGGGRIEAVTPDGDEYAGESSCCHTSDAWTLTTDTTVVDPDHFRVKDPGTYYFKFNLNGYRAGVTLPAKITITVDGGAPPATGSAASSTGGTAAAGPAAGTEQASPSALAGAPAPAQPAVSPADEGIRFGLPVVLGVALAALLVGAAGGVLVTAVVGHLREPGPPRVTEPLPPYGEETPYRPW